MFETIRGKLLAEINTDFIQNLWRQIALRSLRINDIKAPSTESYKT